MTKVHLTLFPVLLQFVCQQDSIAGFETFLFIFTLFSCDELSSASHPVDRRTCQILESLVLLHLKLRASTWLDQVGINRPIFSFVVSVVLDTSKSVSFDEILRFPRLLLGTLTDLLYP